VDRYISSGVVDVHLYSESEYNAMENVGKV
jgi:hypothetical protein